MSEPKANIADRSEQEWAQRERFNQDWQVEQPTLGRVDRLCVDCGAPSCTQCEPLAGYLRIGNRTQRPPR